MVLWIIYSVAILSIIIDFVVNYAIIAYAGCRLFLDDMIMDFVMVTLVLCGLLIPLVLKSALDADDDANKTWPNNFVNLGDETALILVTASNIVFNRLVERMMTTALPHAYRKYLIFRLDQNKFHGEERRFLEDLKKCEASFKTAATVSNLVTIAQQQTDKLCSAIDKLKP